MKKSFKDLIKSVVATSIAAIAGTHGAEAAPVVSFNDSDDDAHQEEIGKVNNDLSYKLMLTFNSEDE